MPNAMLWPPAWPRPCLPRLERASVGSSLASIGAYDRDYDDRKGGQPDQVNPRTPFHVDRGQRERRLNREEQERRGEREEQLISRARPKTQEEYRPRAISKGGR